MFTSKGRADAERILRLNKVDKENNHKKLINNY